MLGKSFVTGGDELAAMRALGGSATLEDELTVRLAAAIGPLVARLAPRLRALATVEAATSGEMQTKFSQECRGMLEYGSLSVFFGGLEALVGSPNPMVMGAMAGEHSTRSDSERDFTTSNYDLRTTRPLRSSGPSWRRPTSRQKVGGPWRRRSARRSTAARAPTSRPSAHRVRSPSLAYLLTTLTHLSPPTTYHVPPSHHTCLLPPLTRFLHGL